MNGLQRSAQDRILLGVCGGIAEKLGVHASWFRLAFVVAALASGVGIAIYLVLALLMRPPGMREASFVQRVRLNLLELRATLVRSASAFERWRVQRELQGEPEGARTLIGLGAVLGGLFILLWSFGLFWWLDAWRTIGIVVALVGIGLLMPARRPGEPRRGGARAAAAATGARASILVVALVVLFGTVITGAGVEILDDDDDATRRAILELVSDSDVRELQAMRERHQADRKRIAELEQRINVLEAWPGMVALMNRPLDAPAAPDGHQPSVP